MHLNRADRTIRHAVICFVAAFWAMLLVTRASADEAKAQLLSTEVVRSDYEAASKDWLPVPQVALDAVVAAEDRMFSSRAAQNSTITIHLGMRYIKHAMRTVILRATQYHNATVLARELTHREILNWYIQEVDFGNYCFGMVDASEAYFGKEIGELEIQDYALLAALIKSPNILDVAGGADKLFERRNLVLEEMSRAGSLAQPLVRQAIASELALRQPIEDCGPK